MSLVINKKLSATGSQQIYHLGSMIRGISIYNHGDDDIVIDFDHVIDGDSRLLPAGQTFSMSIDFEDLYYKLDSGSAATVYVTFVQNP